MQGMYVVLVLGFGLGLLLVSSIGTNAQLDKEAPSGNLRGHRRLDKSRRRAPC